MLEVKELTKSFGGLIAVNRVSFKAREGGILALIGPNGAGKTTVFNLITGVSHPDEGTILFRGQRINRLQPFQIAALGISRTFQNLELFTNLTVAENVMVGAFRKSRVGFLRSVFRRPGTTKEDHSLYREAMNLLVQLGLAHYADQPAGNLPFGQQRLLEIARALATQPQILLLDEPAAGLNPNESRELAVFLRTLVNQGYTLILVEHDMETVMSLADEVVVMNFGTVLASGVPAEVQQNTEVIAAYLGDEEEEAC
ncbi:MAG: ABC transporter ATP-binding protein [Ammonifex sp.]|jgi:branched-chain amino acid transport system ATP-binding protein|nr:MAG: ABC transporter ATP-binding protein [Ammonifex sp.]